MDELAPLALNSTPTAARPLLGLTVLAVEDSLYACEALRLLCMRSGARIRRADCIASAKRHLQVYRPSVILADVGLPDGSGLDLIKHLSAFTPRINIILGPVRRRQNGEESSGGWCGRLSGQAHRKHRPVSGSHSRPFAPRSSPRWPQGLEGRIRHPRSDRL